LPREIPGGGEAECADLEHAGWSKKDYAVQSCFDIYNDRPLGPDGKLPWDQDAKERSDQCFKEVNN